MTHATYSVLMEEQTISEELWVAFWYFGLLQQSQDIRVVLEIGIIHNVHTMLQYVMNLVYHELECTWEIYIEGQTETAGQGLRDGVYFLCKLREWYIQIIPISMAAVYINNIY